MRVARFERRGRRPATVGTVAAVWLGLGVLVVGFGAAWWVVVGLGLFTLPALWDVIRDSRAWVEVWPGRLVWQGAFSGDDTTDVVQVRLNRRFDGSFKILIVHLGGATTRLPPDIAPPPDAFEEALRAAGIDTQRNPFSPF